MQDDRFYTFHEYLKTEEGALSASMEDYLEMIWRLSGPAGFTRIHELSEALHIRQSSATKMVQRLAGKGYVRYQKYGFLTLEEKGKQAGAWLMQRHRSIERFMRMIGVPEALVLEETEKTEHMFGVEATRCLERFVRFLSTRPEVIEQYRLAFPNEDTP